MIRAITHIGLVVSDLERSVSFYRDVLGMKLTGRMSMQGPETDALFQCADCRVHLAYLEHEEMLPGISLELMAFDHPVQSRPLPFRTTGVAELCFLTSDMDALYHDLQQKGVAFLSAPQTFDFSVQGFGMSRAVYFKDPDGTLLELLQELPRL